jgi:hypothetical protein
MATEGIHRTQPPQLSCIQRIRRSEMNEDSYLLRVFSLFYDEYLNLYNTPYLFWKNLGWEDPRGIFQNLKDSWTWLKAFYKKGTFQNSWRVMNNQICDHLSRFVSYQDLLAAASPKNKNIAYICRQNDNEETKLFSEK